MSQKTTLINPVEAATSRRRHRLDIKGQVLGRIATRVAVLLRGKHKPTYTDYVDCGDHVEVVNAKHLVLTGNKIETKFYYSHSGYAGGLKNMPVKRQMERDPRKVVYLAVKRMLGKNRLRSKQLRRLKIYAEGPAQTAGSAAKTAAKPAAAGAKA